MLLLFHDGRAKTWIPLVFGADQIERIACDRFDDLLKERNCLARTRWLPSHTVDNAALEVIERARRRTEDD